ncbi:MAG TPA: hypothetical protein VD768_06730, partial [Sphingomicrobium sp.]|nr:hypothetical protein [Sphingomicrobium sp.]
MDEFSYIFELFALLLGLAVAEMLSGFGQVLKLRARRKAGVDETAIKVRIGWLVPLLGLLVLVDLATFWSGLWMARTGVEMSMLTVFAVLTLIGGYYLVATQVFPDEPQLWRDFDDYYWLQKRFVVLGVVAINVVAQALLMLTAAMPQAEPEEVIANPAFAVAGLLILLNLPAFLWLAFSKRERVDVALIL